MTDYLFYLLLGSGAGAIIACFAVGLVVTYQASGVVNFAHGAMAMWASYLYAELRNGAYVFPIPGLPDRYHFGHDVGFRWALVLSLLTAGVLGFLIYALVFRPLRSAPALAKVVASVGLVIIFISLVDRRFPDTSAIRVKPILPRESVTISEGLTIPRDGFWLAFIALALTAAFWAAGKYLRIGLATRAAAENEKGAVLLGYSPDFLAGLGWILASLSGAAIGILASPLIQLNSGIYTFAFLIPALGAALIGKFQRFWPTLFAGLFIGMIQSTFTKMQNDFSWFPKYGAREGLPFLVIIITMVVAGERLPERGSVSGWKLPSVPPAKVTVQSVALPFAAAVLGLVFLSPLWRAAIMTTTIAAVLALSLVVIIGFGGQTSLAQMAFAGIAGFALSKLAMQYDVPFPIAPIVASLGAALFGLIVGLPALRVRGTNLAIVTLAGGVTVAEFVFKNPSFIGDIDSGGAKVPNPKLGDWDIGLVLGTKTSRPIFGIFLVIVLVLVALAVANVRRGSSGRIMLAVRGNERAAAAIGINVTRVKMQMFAFSSFIAGVGGSLIAYRFGAVSDLSYGTMASLTVLSFAYLGGITSVSGAITAGVTAASGVMFYAMNQVIGGMGKWEAFIGGVLLIFTAIANPEGIAGAIRQQTALARAKKERQKAGVASVA
ncbi:MAG: ABC transporter [Actinobacteria bacterium]|nr:ABC transporter [Actinomycetota bacterium]